MTQAEVNLKEYEIGQRKVAEAKLAKEKETRTKRIKQLEGEKEEQEKSKDVLRSEIIPRAIQTYTTKCARLCVGVCVSTCVHRNEIPTTATCLYVYVEKYVAVARQEPSNILRYIAVYIAICCNLKSELLFGWLLKYKQHSQIGVILHLYIWHTT